MVLKVRVNVSIEMMSWYACNLIFLVWRIEKISKIKVLLSSRRQDQRLLSEPLVHVRIQVIPFPPLSLSLPFSLSPFFRLCLFLSPITPLFCFFSLYFPPSHFLPSLTSSRFIALNFIPLFLLSTCSLYEASEILEPWDPSHLAAPPEETDMWKFNNYWSLIQCFVCVCELLHNNYNATSVGFYILLWHVTTCSALSCIIVCKKNQEIYHHW